MMTQLLKKARDFEQNHTEHVLPAERPLYHLTPNVGWCNDPNGFSWYKGEYHLFYQYHPYSNEWGPMHWGHATSKDLLVWERHPAAMAPDEEYDRAGCFSGSALELPDGKQLLMYTGVQEDIDSEGKPSSRQTQCVAVGDGVNYEKYTGNPVITAEHLPEDGVATDFRDPKIWQDEDGTYFVIVANMVTDGTGRMLLYRSKDAFLWEYCSVLDASGGEWGQMWECPDFFSLQGKQVLILSMMDMLPKDDFHVGHNVGYMLGNYDKGNYQFTRECVQPIDWGIDFYAPQTMQTPDGRRVMVGWMQAWTNSKFVPNGVKYFGQMTVPRELSVRDGKIYQQPIRELEMHRREPVFYKNRKISGEETLEGIRGRVLDMTVWVDLESDFKELDIKFACDKKHHTVIRYVPKKGILSMDRSASGYNYDILHRRELPMNVVDGKLKLRFLLDRFSMEIFINDGEKAATLTYFTPLEAEGIVFDVKGSVTIDIEKYRLEF